ncbi:MAG: ATP-binding protein [Gemmatimonadales bacterium]|nr:ATP-binding protein [Gemmatimonadales bacterium]MYG48017.1 ATP-binding protein [Gemmatimonadales bacterium]MYK00486.1 ATP-binding protein [Candidatus Palauibacter ramosifaciens]
MSAYLPRVADEELKERLSWSGAVLIEGPRACGKTELAQQVAASTLFLDTNKRARDMIAVDPRLVLEGKTPRLIDEWQVEPVIWNHVRRAVDERVGKGHFILTGSAVPPDDATRHPGTGRISRLRLRPMSLFELGHSTGVVSLRDMLDGSPSRSPEVVASADQLARLVCVGGWPEHHGTTEHKAMSACRDYLENICHTDVRRVDGIRRDPDRVRRFLQSLARNVATCATISTIKRDVAGPDQVMKKGTARDYLTALERLMAVEDQPPWSPRLRSRSRLRRAPKRHFVDPSLAVAALRAGPQHLLRDFEWFGFLFESMVVRDLRVYSQAMDADVYHYRDNTGLEVDAIVDAGPDRWAAFEIKLGTGRIDDAARSLLKFADRVDTDRCGEPAALGVIVGNGYGYKRPDGVSVIPIGALGP